MHYANIQWHSNIQQNNNKNLNPTRPAIPWGEKFP